MTPAKTSRRAKAAATRRRILRAAHEEFLAHGFHGATMAAIARRAGVAVQTVYFVFRTKAELIGAVIDVAVLGEQDPTVPQDSGWWEAMEAEPDPAEALRLFVERGADGTSVRDIARAAKVAEGALYRHYESKDALVAQLFATNYTRFAGELEAAQGAEGTGKGKLRAMVAAFCRFFDADPVLFRFLLFVQHGQLAKLADDAATPVTVLQDVMTGAIERREIPRRDPALTTHLFCSSCLLTLYNRRGKFNC